MNGQLREATEPTSDFDRAVEEVKRLEAGAGVKRKAGKKKTAKKAARNHKSKGRQR